MTTKSKATLILILTTGTLGLVAIGADPPLTMPVCIVFCVLAIVCGVVLTIERTERNRR